MPSGSCSHGASSQTAKHRVGGVTPLLPSSFLGGFLLHNNSFQSHEGSCGTGLRLYILFGSPFTNTTGPTIAWLALIQVTRLRVALGKSVTLPPGPCTHPLPAVQSNPGSSRPRGRSHSQGPHTRCTSHPGSRESAF